MGEFCKVILCAPVKMMSVAKTKKIVRSKTRTMALNWILFRFQHVLDNTTKEREANL